MRVLICGDRDWDDLSPIETVLNGLFIDYHDNDDPLVVIEGQCPYGGADRWAAEWAENNAFHGVVHKPYPADWKTLGKQAGSARNTRMLREGNPDVVWAFHDDLSKSRGTANMVAQAKEAGVQVYLVSRL